MQAHASTSSPSPSPPSSESYRLSKQFKQLAKESMKNSSLFTGAYINSLKERTTETKTRKYIQEMDQQKLNA